MVPDQTQVRSNALPIRPNCARTDYDQTQVHRIRLWSDFSDQIDLLPVRLQTMVQTVVCLNFRPDPVISVWEHTGVRSIGSDHKTNWVCTSTWVVISTWAQ